MNKKLILFDNDNTLIKGNKIHRKSFSVGIKKVFNVDASVDEIKTSGMTDTKIVIELLSKRGFSVEEIKSRLKEIFEVMVEFVKENIKDSGIVVNQGIKELLQELKERGCILGLVTGNLEGIAKLKLREVGLLEFFQVGAFGEVSEFRDKLIEKAINQTEKKFNVKIDKRNVFYIGDALLDVEAGKKVKVNTIAVATGVYSKEDLEKSNPDFIFDKIDKNSIIKIIESD
jgi:phosphoglycolate phosphatase-like HAD superfamily hydrolase